MLYVTCSISLHCRMLAEFYVCCPPPHMELVHQFQLIIKAVLA